MRDERGVMTLWVLGLCVAVLILGGLALDLWRVLGARRDLAAMADAAATAGANGLDEASLRAGGTDLEPAQARGLALDNLDRQPGSGALAEVVVDADTSEVVVRLRAEVELTLVDLLSPAEPVTVEVTARAEPRRRGP